MKQKSPMQYLNMTKSRGKNYYDRWTSAIIYRIIRNQIYIGNTYKRKTSKKDYRQKKRDFISSSDRDIVLNTHQAIISKELFKKANSMIKTNNKKINRLKDYEGYLHGIVKCGECGKIMNVAGRKKENGRVIYNFYCTEGKNKNRECSNNKTISTKLLEDMIYDLLIIEMDKITERKIIEESYEYMSYQKKNNNEIEMLDRQIEIKKKSIKELYLKKASNQIILEDFIEKRKQLNQEITQFKDRQKELRQELVQETKKQEIRDRYSEFKKETNVLNYANDLVKEIKFYADRKIKIIFAFRDMHICI